MDHKFITLPHFTEDHLHLCEKELKTWSSTIGLSTVLKLDSKEVSQLCMVNCDSYIMFVKELIHRAHVRLVLDLLIICDAIGCFVNAHKLTNLLILYDLKTFVSTRPPEYVLYNNKCCNGEKSDTQNMYIIGSIIHQLARNLQYNYMKDSCISMTNFFTLSDDCMTLYNNHDKEMVRSTLLAFRWKCGMSVAMRHNSPNLSKQFEIWENNAEKKIKY